MTLTGEGEFNLNVLKEIQVTNYFLNNIEEEVRKCQNGDTITNCETDYYKNTLLEKCGCIPFRISLSDKVPPIHKCINTFNHSDIMQDPLCSPEDEACVQSVNVSTNNTSCLKPCSGLVLTSFSHSKFDEKLDNLLYEEVIAYNNYKKWFQYPDNLKGTKIQYFTHNT